MLLATVGFHVYSFFVDMSHEMECALWKSQIVIPLCISLAMLNALTLLCKLCVVFFSFRAMERI
ncbi:hypothetical protein E2C01_066465 [Portunus trituberculatus]|uniref:Uncharacterized protein n=1 Tax=Portunus trituberculatus TaxID=210409 RepID=A0A5B7HH59_PORTR|nr:hypothetical protein [Portunus trituberculatus]